MEYDIFISYSRADTQIVDQFVTKLTDAGYRVWIDREGIIGGEQFKIKIVRAIKSSALVVFFSSARSTASQWIIKEISYSTKKEKIIIPVKLDETEYAESIGFDLIDIDFIQYQPNHPASTIERLIKSISIHISKPLPSNGPFNPNVTLSSCELYSCGISHYEKHEYKQAIEYFQTAAKQGDTDAQYLLGLCYENGRGVPQDYNEAVKWYRKAAEQGDDEAQIYLGYCYENGMGVAQDYIQAFKWYSKAAEQGEAMAQNNLGIYYMNGWSVSQDYYEGVYWFRKAAKQGNAMAQNNLGTCFYDGLGVPKDYKEAVKWYKEAAEQGEATAQNNLGACYKNGQGVPKDRKKAIELFQKSAEQGNELAIKNLKRLGKWPK